MLNKQPDWKPGFMVPVMWQKEIDLHSPFLAGGNGHHTVKALFQKPPTAKGGLFLWGYGKRSFN